MSVLNNFLSFFIPKDKKFFDIFEKSGANLVQMGVELKSLMADNGSNRAALVKKIHELENVGDTLTHDSFVELSSNFITPFDREDIHALTSALDNIADYIDAVSKRVDLYQMDEITEPMKQLADLAAQAIGEVNVALKEMRSMKNVIRVKEALVRINSIENHSDTVYNYAIAELFKNEKDAIRLLKHREILEHLENVSDRCEDVADVIESIIIKNS
jgi:uncharacterized protein